MCNPGDSETSRTGKLMASLTICHSTSSGTSGVANGFTRSEEHTSELQSRLHLVCRLLLEKKENTDATPTRLQLYNIAPRVARQRSASVPRLRHPLRARRSSPDPHMPSTASHS